MNGWEIPVLSGVGLILVLVYTLGNSVFYSFLIKNEKEVEKKVEKEIEAEIRNYKKKDINHLIDRLVILSSILADVSGGKDYFSKKIIWSGIFTILFFLGYLVSANTNYFASAASNPTEMFWYVSLLSLFYMIYSFHKLSEAKDHMERYLNGEDVEDIFEEKRSYETN